MAASETFAAVATAVWMIFVLLSTPDVRLHPEVRLLAFLPLMHSGSRLWSRFLVEEGA